MKSMPLFCLTVLALTLCSAGCGGGDEGCKEGEGAELVLTLNPSSGRVQANGTSVIKASVVGRDEKCKPFADGTPVEFRITDQEPENPNQEPEGLGMFSNGGTTIVVPYSSFGISTNITGTVVGTAKVSAFCETYNLHSAPLSIEFTEPSQPGQCAVELSPDPPFVPADGSSTLTITATLTADTGGPMSDGTTVTFTTTKGKFTGSGGQNFSTQTTNNIATAILQSESSPTTIQAEVTATFTCDDGKEHSNKVGVTFGEASSPAVYLSASSNEVLADNVSTVTLTAEIFLPGGVRAGAGEDVTFFTDVGRFQQSGTTDYTAQTDSNGRTTATFIGGNQGGVATVSASVYIQDIPASDTVQINIRQLGFVEFVSAVPPKMGVKGSGKNETSEVTFVVKDTEGIAFPAGFLVDFTLSLAPGVTLDAPSALTDSNGQVKAVLNSGTVATTVTVTATAHVGTETLQAVSSSIAIVGAKPASRNITFSCERFNVGGLVLNFVDTKCTVGLADRYSNKLGFATNVIFQTEAGSIDANALTSEALSNMGEATVTATTGMPRPKDVSPLANEPFVGNYNPRDGIVTIIVVTTGEEFFDDVNGNGRYDSGEPFDDEEEPFVDKDDDGVRDPDEFLGDANNNGVHDGPNGVWDSNTLIWARTYMLWTGEMAVGNPDTDCALPYRHSVLCPKTFFILKGQELEFEWEVKDINLNPLNSTLRVDFEEQGKGSKGISDPPLSWTAPDTLGGFVNPTAFWTDCGGGFCGMFTIKGAAVTDTTPSAPGTVSLNVTYNQTPGGGARRDQTITISGTFE